MNHIIDDTNGSSQSLERKGEGARIPGILDSLSGKNGGFSEEKSS